MVLAVVGCEKDPPAAATPTESADAGGPTVVVEEPGSTPEPTDPEPEPEPEGPPGRTEIHATDVPCKDDADCVKDSCCHATSCVAAAAAPNCSQAMCTMDCRAGTMDCNGGCLCQDGTCAAKVWFPPAI